MTIEEKKDLVYGVLPQYIDRTPRGVFKSRADIGDLGYFENSECVLIGQFNKDGLLTWFYYSENDTYHFLNFEDYTKESIVKGFENLTKRSISKFQ